MSYPTATEKNKAIVLLRKAGMPMNEIVKAFSGKDKRNFYRVWHRDYNKYFLPLEKNGISKRTSIE